MSDDDTYEIPLQDQRVFGAGIKRKRVKFVPSTSNTITSTPTGSTSAKSVSDLYLKLVLPEDPSHTVAGSSSSELFGEGGTNSSRDEQSSQVCEICNLPLTVPPALNNSKTNNPDNTDASPPTSNPHPHEASLAHQVCLTHSYPPSYLDRNRKGLAYLSSYGWDPDSRLGLGASGQGIQFPIKTKPKDDKMGIGVVLPKEADRRRKEKVEKLDAGKVKKMYEKDKRKTEKLRNMFYQNEDVERYLGGS